MRTAEDDAAMLQEDDVLQPTSHATSRFVEYIEARDREAEIEHHQFHHEERDRLRKALEDAGKALQDCTAAMAMQIGRENETLHIHVSVAREIWDRAYAGGLAAIEAARALTSPRETTGGRDG